jgi:hypothetical protein
MHFASDRVRLFRARTGTPTRDSKYEGAPLQVRACERLPELRNLRHALDPSTAELNLKVISRSIFGFELAIDAILSRSSVDSERVARLRTLSRPRRRAASAGDVVRPRVTRGGFSAFIMSSAERCSAAKANPEERAKPTAKSHTRQPDPAFAENEGATCVDRRAAPAVWAVRATTLFLVFRSPLMVHRCANPAVRHPR